ncbi:MAG TPA: ScyD/ScyE family protein, partial [Pyrinomonadaceae bacterium]|nr:ScyD/ScyE family protein [Pyrinomonadaceae bacterium]
SVGFSLILVAATILLAAASTMAQCSEVVSGLRTPTGITQSNQNNLIVSENGTLGVLHSGRISIVDPDGSRRTLLGGLPSATSDVGEPSGPAGVFVRGRTLYLVIGLGNTLLPGGIPNDNPASPIFSSLLAIHFSAAVEKTTNGFTLTPANQQTLADGGKVTLSNGSGRIKIELIANFPDFTVDPITTSGFRNVNPFDVVVVGDQAFVTDGGQNLVWQVDLPTGAFSALATFPRIPNPLFNPAPPPPSIGGPLLEAVPTGIRYFNGQLLVTLFRGFPFPPGVSVVEQIDPLTGSHSPLITGLRTAIDVLPLEGHYLVLQHTSGTTILPPFITAPGVVLDFATPAGPPTVVTNCLTRPTSMTFDEKTGLLYVTELGGRVVEVAGASPASPFSNSWSFKSRSLLRSTLRTIQNRIHSKVKPD